MPVGWKGTCEYTNKVILLRTKTEEEKE